MAEHQQTWYQEERSEESSAAVCVSERAIKTSWRHSKNSTSSRPEEASKRHDLGFGVVAARDLLSRLIPQKNTFPDPTNPEAQCD